MRHVAIIQARLGSSRFPGKTLERLYDKSLLEHILERVRATRQVQAIVVATTLAPSDDPLARVTEHLRVGLFRGSETNVLERFHGAAMRFGAEVIVRVTADDPFKDPEVIDQGIQLLHAGNYDYCSNTLKPSFPEGIDIEVFRVSALDRAFREARLDSEKEHVTPYVWKHPEIFRLHNFSYPEDLSHLRWTIDYENDLHFAREVYRRLYPNKRIFLMRDILDLLAEEPELSKINSGVMRNEGYGVSLAKEAQK